MRSSGAIATPLVAFAAAYAPAGRAEDVVQERLANAWVSLARIGPRGRAEALALHDRPQPGAERATRRALSLESSTRRSTGSPVRIRSCSSATSSAAPWPPSPRSPKRQRKALVESAIEGRTHDQIAAELGTSAGSVRGLIHRGRVAVRGAVGALVPFPVAAWAAGSGGAVAGGVAAGTALGGSLAAKGAAVATIAVLATGSGLVVERSLNDSAKSDREAGAAETAKSEAATARRRLGGEDTSGHGHGARKTPDRAATRARRQLRASDGDDSDRDDDNSGPGRDDDSGHGGGDDDSSGPGSGDDSDEDNSGHGSGDDDSSGHGSGADDDDNSGSGSSGGSSGSRRRRR